MTARLSKSTAAGASAFALLLGIYFTVLALLSGGAYAADQFGDFWHYIVPLAAGFGVQVGLFVRLRQVLTHAHHAGAVTAASGGTSTIAMLSCCAHYIANVAPTLAATGFITFAAEFQIAFFWVGMLFNIGGIAFVATRLRRATRSHPAGARHAPHHGAAGA